MGGARQTVSVLSFERATDICHLFVTLDQEEIEHFERDLAISGNLMEKALVVKAGYLARALGLEMMPDAARQPCD